eukprot:scaffold23069_cov79-Attheya_sp.AAC.4
MAGYLICLTERNGVRLVVDVPSVSPVASMTTTSSTLLLAVSGAVVHHVHIPTFHFRMKGNNRKRHQHFTVNHSLHYTNPKQAVLRTILRPKTGF